MCSSEAVILVSWQLHHLLTENTAPVQSNVYSRRSWQQLNLPTHHLSALLQGNKVVSAFMGLFNSFLGREQSPNHHALDPTALREALACLPGSKFQLGEFLCSGNEDHIWQDTLGSVKCGHSQIVLESVLLLRKQGT